MRHYEGWPEDAFEHEFGIPNLIHRFRIAGMISGDKLTKEDFQLLTVASARQIIRRFVQNEVQQEELVECVEEESITGFILKDILTRHFNFDKVKTAIQQKVKEGKDIGNSVIALRLIEEQDSKAQEIIKNQEKETEEERKKRIGFPSDNIEQLIKDAGFEESLEKFKEAKVDDETFWSFIEVEYKPPTRDGDKKVQKPSPAKLEAVLEMKSYGKRLRFMKKLGQIKMAHLKKAYEENEEKQKLEKNSGDLFPEFKIVE